MASFQLATCRVINGVANGQLWIDTDAQNNVTDLRLVILDGLPVTAVITHGTDEFRLTTSQSQQFNIPKAKQFPVTVALDEFGSQLIG